MRMIRRIKNTILNTFSAKDKEQTNQKPTDYVISNDKKQKFVNSVLEVTQQISRISANQSHPTLQEHEFSNTPLSANISDDMIYAFETLEDIPQSFESTQHENCVCNLISGLQCSDLPSKEEETLQTSSNCTTSNTEEGHATNSEDEEDEQDYFSCTPGKEEVIFKPPTIPNLNGIVHQGSMSKLL